MNKLINFFDDFTKRFSVYFIAIQNTIAWLSFGFVILIYKIFLIFKANNGYNYILEMMMLLLIYTITYGIITLIFVVSTTIKFLIKEKNNANFRINNFISNHFLIKKIITILFTIGFISLIGYVWLCAFLINTDLFNYISPKFYTPIIIFLIAYLVYKIKNKYSNNIWTNILFYSVEPILLLGLIYTFKLSWQNKCTGEEFLFLGIPYTILLYWIYKKINTITVE